MALEDEFIGGVQALEGVATAKDVATGESG